MMRRIHPGGDLELEHYMYGKPQDNGSESNLFVLENQWG